MKYNSFKIQAEADTKAEQKKVADGEKAITDAKARLVTDLAESKANYLKTQKSYNTAYGKLQIAIRKGTKGEAVGALKDAADKLRNELKDKRSHWDKFADAKNGADAEAAEEVAKKKRAGEDDVAKKA